MGMNTYQGGNAPMPAKPSLTVGKRVHTPDGIGYITGRSKRHGVMTYLVRMPNGANYPYRAEDLERVS